ncbi:MAG: TonB-dependent receptor [Rudaea sp.]|nr:TonB-dependent receptor [Rudaea sp.]
MLPMLVGMGLAGFAVRLSAQTVDTQTTSADALKQMSLDELMNIDVTSVSRHPEKLSRAASAIQVITADDIRRSGATSIPEALRLADNLDVAQKNSHDWAITARGFNTALANKLLVLVDGRTVYTPLFSGVFWDAQNYLLADIDRIEVISGPGGTLWGANAVNGVINIITKSASDTQGTYLEAGAGTQLQDFTGARYGAALAPDIHFRIYADYFNRGSETLANGNDANDAWNQGQGGFRLDAQLSPHNALTVQGDFYGGDEGEVAGGTARISGGNILGRWSHAISDSSDMSLQVYYDRTHLSDPVAALVLNSTVFAPAGILTDDLDTYDVDFQHRFVLNERNHVEWGLGYRYTHDTVEDAPALAFSPPVLDQRLFSGFVQDEITLRENLLLTVGTKLEHNDYTGFELEPSARIRWDFSANQMLWAAISRAVRTPSRIDHDLSEPAPPAPIEILEGSTDFVSETVIARELGYRAQLGANIAMSVSAFYNDYDHVRSTGITPVTLLPFVFQNNLEGETHGVELSIDYQAADWWRLHGGYDPLRENLRVKPGTFDLNAAQNETADPQQRFALRSSMDLPRSMELDVALRWTDVRYINDGPTIEPVPPYWEMDVRLGWHPIEKVEFSIGGQNLLHDHHVEYGFPGPAQVTIGRSVYGKVVWRF